MPAREALRRAAAIIAGDLSRATLSLRHMARVGLVHSRARFVDGPGSRTQTSVDLPASFWAPPKGLLANAAGPVPLEDWKEGSFEGGGTAFGPGKASDVEFLRSDVDRHYPARSPQTPVRASSANRGRKKRAGCYDLPDAPLLEAMRQLRESGEALSDHKAAQQVVEGAIGGGTEGSKIKRLTTKYKQQFPDLN